MNKTYRSIWNASLGCYVAAPECATSRTTGSSRSRTARAHPMMRSKSVLVMEPRLLFDGAMVATAIELDSGSDDAPVLDEAAEAEPAEAPEAVVVPEAQTAATDAPPADTDAAIDSDPAAQDTVAGTDADTDDTALATAPEAPARTEVVFVDSRVTDPAAFGGEGREVVVVAADQDGIAQIASALAGRTGIDAIHIVSHGSDGQLSLGSGSVTADTLQSTHQAALQLIGQALSAEGDILIYACDYAAGSAGLEAMNLIADLTGADVAASSDATGHESLGGDWTLEQSTGDIETTELAPLAWMNALDFTFTGAGTVGALGMANNIMGAGVTVVSATYQGGATQSGTFTAGSGVTFGSNVLGFTSGTLLSTGNNAAGVAGPNSLGDYGDDALGVDGDPALNALAGNPTFDAAILNISFVPDVPPGGNVGDVGRMTLEIVFGSEEYLEYVGSFNDVMEVTINGQVVSLVPNASGGESTIGINSVNTTQNPSLFVDNAGSTYNTQMDAFTVTIPMVFDVIVGQTNTLRLAVADAVDASLDSWLFIRADSGQTVVVAEDDQVTTAANLPITVDLTANDYSLAGGSMTLTHIQGQAVTQGQVITLGSGIQLTVGSGGQVTVTGNGSTAVNDTFTYEVSNGLGGIATATVNVDVTAPNLNPPDARNDVEAVLADATLSDSVLTNNGNGADTDPNGNPLSVVQVNLTSFTPGDPITLPSGALLTMNANGTYVYDPNGAFDGLADGATTTDSFSYTITDGQGGNDTATVTITVTGVASTPTVLDLDGNDSGGAAGLSTTYGPSLVVNGDLSAGNSGFTSDYVAVANTGGLLSEGTYYVGVASDVWTLTGQDNITTDPFGDPDGPVMYVNGSPNPGDVYWSQTFAVDANTDYDFSVWATNANAWAGTNGNGDADPLFELVVNGSVVASGQLSYLTAGQWEQFTGTWNSGSATSVTVSMLSASTSAWGNDLAIASLSFSEVLARTAANFETTFTEDGGAVAIADGDTTITSAAAQMDSAQVTLTNAQAGDTLTVSGSLPGGITASVSTALDGRITLNLSGTASRADYETAIEAIRFGNSSEAPDTTDRRIEVLVTDAGGSSNLAVTTVRVVAVNDAPVATDDTYTAGEEGAAALGNPLGNDSDADGDALSLSFDDANGSQGGLVTTDDSGNLVFIAGDDFDDLAVGETRNTQFTYTLSDGQGATASASITVTVEGANDAPVTAADAFDVDEDGAWVLAGVLDNDTDPEGDGMFISFSGMAGSNGGVFTMDDGGNLIFIPGTDFDDLNDGQSRQTSFTYDVNDVHGAQTASTVTVTVHGVNDAPVAASDSFSVYEDDAVILGNLTINDSDIDGGVLQVDTSAVVAGDNGGLFSFDDGGSLVFNPNGDFNDLAEGESRSTRFDYTLYDGQGGTSLATVVVEVMGLNDAPVAVDDTLAAYADHAMALGSALANDSDPEGHALELAQVQAAGSNGGLLALDDSHNLVFNPDGAFDDLRAGETRDTVFAYTVADSLGGLSQALLTVTVTGVNDDPVAVDDAYETGNQSAVILGNPMVNDSDVDGDTMDLGQTSPGEGSHGGLFTMDDGGGLVFDPDGAFDDLAEGETRETSFSYTVSDGQGGAATATVTVTVRGEADGGDDVVVAMAAPSYPNEVVFVDARIPDPQAFAADGRELVVLNLDDDGLLQIAAALNGRSGVEAVHIVSHGGDGYLTLGNGDIDAGSIQSYHLPALQAMASALSEGGDILIYACDFAASEVGQNTMLLLAQYTVADVAASLGTTGHPTLNGNWVLEVAVGSVEAQTITPENWVYALNQPAVGAPVAPAQEPLALSPVTAPAATGADVIDPVSPAAAALPMQTAASPRVLSADAGVRGLDAPETVRMVTLEDVFRQTLSPYLPAATAGVGDTATSADPLWAAPAITVDTDLSRPEGWQPTAEFLDDSLVHEALVNEELPEAREVDALELPRQHAAPGFAAQLARWSQWGNQRPLTRAAARA